MDRTTREYHKNDWAVKRWDALHNGRIVQPKSFCQFWRAVVLWCTLMQLPWVGREFIEVGEVTNANAGPPPVWMQKTGKVLQNIGNAIWIFLRWTLLIPFRGLWFVFSCFVEFTHDHARLMDKIGTGIAVATIAGLLILGLACLVLLMYFLVKFLVVGNVYAWVGFVSVVAVITTGLLLGEHASGVVKFIDHASDVLWEKVAWPFLVVISWPFRKVVGVVWGVMRLLFDITLSGKKMICPPMTIVR